jgi:SAM and SH3 domain-containing protein 1
MAPFGDVLLTLEDARQKAWSDRSPKHIAGMNKGHRGSSNQIGSLPNSHSQPIYVPGKYSVRYIDYDILNVFCYNGNFLQPSSCLSDKEEDEIYGFGYGVFAPRVGRNTSQSIQGQMPQQQSLPNNSTNVPVTPQQNQQQQR